MPTALAPTDTLWAVMREWLGRITDPSALLVDAQAVASQRRPPVANMPVSIVPIHGLLTHRPDLVNGLMGGTSVEEVRQALRAAMADHSTRAVILDFDTPGGTVAGTTELANEIRAMRGGGKPIVALADTLMASAGYWLGSQADEVWATPSSQTGSVGIYAVHQEGSRALDAQGVTTTVISAGPYKAEANEWEPLTDEARAALQERADAYYAQFVADVARGRRVTIDRVRSDFGQGRALMAPQARAAGMIDGITTLDALVARLAGQQGQRAVAASDLGPEMVASAVRSHSTATDGGAWDAAANEGRLPSPMPVATARAAYAWIDEEAVADGEMPKSAGRFIHHEVGADGRPGAANLTACSAGIGVLNGGRGGTTIPDADRQGVHAHLAAHMMDADREAPALRGEGSAQRFDAVDALLDYHEHRSALRAKEGRPAYSTTTETRLRGFRDRLDALLALGDPAGEGDTTNGADDPPASVEPMAPPVPPQPRRFRTDAEWRQYVAQKGRS